MKNYLFLLWKRLWRLLPMALLGTLLLMAAFSAIVWGALDASQAESQKFSVALCGSTDDPLVQLGISALQSLDDTRFSVEIRTMTEDNARQALLDGQIGAYAVLPEGFVESALYGTVPTVRYVTLAGNTGLAAIFQQEVTQVISQILLSAQKGVYGIAAALRRNGQDPYIPMNRLALEYVELALLRGQTYELRVLGISSGLGLYDYLACGLGVLLVFLLCLSFAPMLVQQDVSVNRMLAAKGLPVGCQALGEFSLFALGLGLLTGTVFLALTAAGISLPYGFVHALPVVLTAAAFSFFAFSLVRERLSGVLLQFLATLGVCFLSGCMYPAAFFPEAVQKVAVWLPANACREYLAACIAGKGIVSSLAATAVFSAVFLTAAVILRSRRVRP